MADVRIIVDEGNVVRVERLNRGLLWETIKDATNVKDVIDLVKRTNPVPTVGKILAVHSAAHNIENSPVLTAQEKADALALLNQVYVYDDVALSERPGELERMRAAQHAEDTGAQAPLSDRVRTGVFDP